MREHRDFLMRGREKRKCEGDSERENGGARKGVQERERESEGRQERGGKENEEACSRRGKEGWRKAKEKREKMYKIVNVSVKSDRVAGRERG